jgi:Putative transposase
MTLDGPEFIRRFLMHVLPTGFHRIRHYGPFASGVRACNIERVRALLAVAEASPQQQPKPDGGTDPVDGAHKMPLLRRPDDRHRNLRRRAPRATGLALSDQDRHLMTIMTQLFAPQFRSPSPPSNPHSGSRAANAAFRARDFLLERLSNAGPCAGPFARVGSGVRNPSSLLTFLNGSATVGSRP